MALVFLLVLGTFGCVDYESYIMSSFGKSWISIYMALGSLGYLWMALGDLGYLGWYWAVIGILR